MAAGDSNHTEILSDETFDFLCSVCARKNKSIEAEKFCTDCHDYYCLNCVIIHEEVPALSDHHILDKQHFTAGTKSTLPALPTERCKLHGHKPVDMFCQDHDTVGCSTCMASAHRVCRDVVYIPDYVKHISVSDDAQTLLKSFETIMNQLENLKCSLAGNKEDCALSKETITTQIRKVRKDINKTLYELERNTLDELKDRIKFRQDDLDSKSQTVQGIIDNVRSSTDKLKAAGGNISQLFVSAKLVKNVTSEATKIIYTTNVDTLSHDFTFTVTQKLTLLLNEIRCFGETIMQEAKCPRSYEQATLGQPDQENTSLNPAICVSEVSACDKYSVKVERDAYTCNISGICIMEDGTVILSDTANCRLKRLDSSTCAVTDFCCLPGYPWQVCEFSKQEVAVCLGDSKKILIVRTSNMQITLAIKTSFECFGLAYVDHELYVSNLVDDQPLSIFSLNTTGEVSREFRLDQPGQPQLSEISSLAVSNDKTKLYVTDSYEGLLVLNLKDGELIGQFNGSELQCAWGVSVENDRVLVSGLFSKNVLLFNSNGKLLQELIKSDGECQAVAYRDSKVVLSLKRNDQIAVCKLVDRLQCSS